jgi:hypothetical protein
MVMDPVDGATAHLLVAAAYHDAATNADEHGDPSIGEFPRVALHLFEEQDTSKAAPTASS